MNCHENYCHKKDYERHVFPIEICVDYHYSRKYGGSNCEWINMDDFFDQGELVIKLHPKYKFYLPQQVKKKLKICCKLELHVSHTTTETAKAIQAHDGIRDNKIKSLI